MQFGIRANVAQVLQQLLQVLLVGMTIGMMRNVVPALAESEFGVERGSFMMLVAFVVAFGFVKGAMNFIAGRLAEKLGRRLVLLIGWLVALPIPALVAFAPSWNWIVLATILLGVNQGLTWSMTQTATLDLTWPDQRGLVIGLNEFSGYVGVRASVGHRDLSLLARPGLRHRRARPRHRRHVGGRLETAFWFVATAMLLSGAWLHHWGEETHPGLNPAS
jgi:MFS family permease